MLSAATVVAVLLLVMLFFGTDTQREVATDLLSTGLTGLGGAGVMWLFGTMFKRAMNDGRDD